MAALLHSARPRTHRQHGLVARVSGFTLIELVIVLVIVVLLLLASAALTKAWVDSARVLEGRSIVLQAYAKAKGVALRNASAATGVSGATAVAASLCLSNNQLYVHNGAYATCGQNPAWVHLMPNGVSLKLNELDFVCMGLANNGLPVGSLTIAGQACASAKNFSVSRGSEHVEDALF